MLRSVRYAALAASVMFFGTSSASAVVVYSGLLNAPVPNTFDGLFVNVVTGSTFSGPGFPTSGGPGANYDFNPFGSTSWSFFSPGSSGQDPPTPVPANQKGYVASATNGPVSNLPFGTLIDGSSTYNSGTPSGSAVATGSEAFIGFRLRNEQNSPHTVHYGWARLILANGQPGTLVDYAWENTADTGITAGAGIPEPAAMSVLGIAGLVALRLRRRS